MGPGDSKGRGNCRDLRESASRDDERAMVTVDSWGEGEGFVQGVVSCHSGLNYTVEPLGEGLVAGESESTVRPYDNRGPWDGDGCQNASPGVRFLQGREPREGPSGGVLSLKDEAMRGSDRRCHESEQGHNQNLHHCCSFVVVFFCTD